MPNADGSLPVVSHDDAPPYYRDATPEDARELSRMVNSAFEVESRFLKVDGRGRIAENELRELIAAGECALICMCQAATGRVLGSILYKDIWARPSTSAAAATDGTGNASAGYLGMLAVWPHLQGRGLGAALMRQAEQRAVSRGHRVMQLNVISARLELFSVLRKAGICVLRGEGRVGRRRPPPRAPGAALELLQNHAQAPAQRECMSALRAAAFAFPFACCVAWCGGGRCSAPVCALVAWMLCLRLSSRLSHKHSVSTRAQCSFSIHNNVRWDCCPKKTATLT
eukprot:Opistho-2@36568